MFSLEDVDVTDPTDFSDPVLRELDNSLRCPVCKDFFRGPVLLQTCGHSFCSLCIRQTLRDKRECPSCRVAASENTLSLNPAMEAVVMAYEKARPIIMDALTKMNQSSPVSSQKRKRSGASPQSEDDEPGPSKKKNWRTNPSPIKTGKNREDAVEIASSPEPAVDGEQMGGSSANPDDDNEFAKCPKCDTMVIGGLMQMHHDYECAGVKVGKSRDAWGKVFGANGGLNPATRDKTKKVTDGDDEPPQARLPKVTYHTLPLKDVKALLAKHKLSTEGEKETLADRHAQWITLYNSNLDTARPKSIPQLREELKLWEAEKVKSKKDKRAREKKIADPVKYAEEQKDDFDALIRGVRQREKRTLPKNSKSEP